MPDIASRKFTEKDEIATAYHESGHAVAAFYIGVRVKKATIVRSKGLLGAVHHANVFGRSQLDMDRSTRVRMRVERAILISLAGPAAEAKFLGRPSIKGKYAHADYSAALDVADHMSESREEAEAYVHWLEIRAKGKVEALWSDIGKVAAALMAKKTLKGKEVEALLR